MWIWLSISMILVIACIIFGIYSFISSRTLQRTISADPAYPGSQLRPFIKSIMPVVQQQAVLNFKTKLKSIEENSLLSAHHLNELQKKVEALESTNRLNTTNEEAKWDDSGEDWEKMYYDSRKEKQSLDETLNGVKNALQENGIKLHELEKQQSDWAAMKSDVESVTNEVHHLNNIIKEMQRKLEGSVKRENELEKKLVHEKSRYVECELLQQQNHQLQSEIDTLVIDQQELNEHNHLLEKKIKNLAELESMLEISEFEKREIRNSVEQLLQK